MNVNDALINACRVWLKADRDGHNPTPETEAARIEADALVDHAVDDFLRDPDMAINQIREDRPNGKTTGIVRIVLEGGVVLEVDANEEKAG